MVQRIVLPTLGTSISLSLMVATGSSVNTQSLSTVLLGEEEAACVVAQMSWGILWLESFVAMLELTMAVESLSGQLVELSERACRAHFAITGLPQPQSGISRRQLQHTLRQHCTTKTVHQQSTA